MLNADKNFNARLCLPALLFLLTLFSMVALSPVKAVTVEPAHLTIERTTSELVDLIKQAQDYIDDDETKFYAELGQLLRRYIDFESFSRAVMGKYASKKRLESMTEADQQQLLAQIDKFTHVLTSSLINTYGKGLLVFEGEKIEVVAPEASELAAQQNGKARVKQLIYGDREKPYEIYYSLRKNGEGEWKIRNMVIESSNLGKIYRNQFDNAYKVYEGDIDRVIENWVNEQES